MPRLTALIAAWALALVAAPVHAEVVERSADHFVLKYEVGLETTPEDIYAAIGDVSHWWAGSHTYSGFSANLSMPLEAGACYCEALADGTTFEHGRVLQADPATGVLLEAPLGPLKGKTTMARWSIGWLPANRGWTLVMTYVVRGTGVGAFADAVDGVMGQQFGRLTHLMEYGEAAEVAS